MYIKEIMSQGPDSLQVAQGSLNTAVYLRVQYKGGEILVN